MIQKRFIELKKYETETVRLIRLSYSTAPKYFDKRLTLQTFTDGIDDTEIRKYHLVARIFR